MLKKFCPAICATSTLILVTNISCTEEHTSYLPIEGETKVHIDSLISHPPLNAMSMGATKDFLVVANSGRDSIIDLYALPSGEFICCGVVAGGGPGEVIHPDTRGMTITDDSLINIPTGKPHISAVISLPELKVTNQTIPIPNGWNFTQAMVPINNMKGYFMQNGSLPNNWALVDESGAIKTNYDTEIPKSMAKKVSHNEFAQILARSSIGVYSAKAQRFAVCYKTFPEVRIFDINGKQINILRNNDHTWTGEKLWIVSAQSTSESIFINIHNPDDREFTESSVIEIDWDGNVKSSYKVPRAVGAFCVTNDSHTVFFTGNRDSDYIYKFEIR